MKIETLSYKNADEAIGVFLISCLYTMLIYSLFRRILGLSGVLQYGFLGALGVVFVLINFKAIATILFAKRTRFLFFEIVVAVIYFYSYLLGNSTVSIILSYIANTAIVCGIMFIMASAITDVEKTYKKILQGSYGLTIISLLSIFAVDNGSYSMGFSYIVLMPMLVFANELFRKITIKNAVFFSIEFFLVLVFGSRGSILCVVVYVALRMILVKGRGFLKLSIIAVIGAFLAFYEQIGIFVLNLLNSYGIYSRSLTLFFTRMDYVSGRDKIQESAMELLALNKWIGYGASSSENMIGGYPHNIFVEILFDYGYIGGAILIFLLMTILVTFILKSKKDTAILFFCWGFVPLFLSNSYMKEWKFFFLLGIVYGQFIRKKRTVKKCS